MSSLNVPRGIFRKIDWLVEKVKWLIYKVNNGGGGGNLPSGEPRQLMGFDDNGNPSAINLGWDNFSTEDNPPPFESSVLTYQESTNDFVFSEVSQQATPNTIAQRQDNGALQVGDPVIGLDAVNLKSLNTMISGINVVTDEIFTFGNTGYYTYIGDNNITVPLPDVDTSVGRRYVILNTTGDGALEITGNIFESGTPIATFNIAPGENYIIYSNGMHWVIV